MSLFILNGPNLDQLGTREPEVYGTATLDEIMAEVVTYGADRGVTIDHAQSSLEGEMVDHIHRAGRGEAQGIVLNAGAYSHYSYAIRDAVAGAAVPVVETHLSNLAAREEFRHTSVIAPVCLGVVAGFGADSYRIAVDALLHHLGGAS